MHPQSPCYSKMCLTPLDCAHGASSTNANGFLSRRVNMSNLELNGLGFKAKPENFASPENIFIIMMSDEPLVWAKET